MNVEATIAEALLWHLGQFSTDLPIFNPGFSAAPTGPHIRADVFPAQPVNAALKRWEQHTGTMQASVYATQNQFIVEPMKEASRLADHFRGQTLEHEGVKVRIIEPPAVQGALYQTDWIHIPVDIRWTSWVRL